MQRITIIAGLLGLATLAFSAIPNDCSGLLPDGKGLCSPTETIQLFGIPGQIFTGGGLIICLAAMYGGLLDERYRAEARRIVAASRAAQADRTGDSQPSRTRGS